jgi:peptidoglycan/xylan/chitin deacetylase (PgdA/CDA1 family)
MRKAVKYFFGILIFIFPASGVFSADKDITDSVKAALFMSGSLDIGKTEFTAMRRILDSQGIPYDIISDPSDLGNYKTAFISGPLTDKGAGTALANILYEYVERGGTFLTAGEIGKTYYSMFDVEDYYPSRKRYTLSFTGTDPVLEYLDTDEERTISLGNGSGMIYREVIWSHGYRVSGGAEILGTFADSTAGFIKKKYGRGNAYLLGVSFTESVMLPQLGNDYEAQRLFVNSFEPSADAVMLIVKSVYKNHNGRFFFKGTNPSLRSTSLVITHDVDAQTAFVDSLKFAELEKKYGTSATYFQNTKYFTDSNDIDYYNIRENREAIIKLKKTGFDIGSHTVSHYIKLQDMPVGERNVRFASYNPLKRITLRGEAAVSKELLDRDIPGQSTISFRSGNLAFHKSLIGVLEDYGYLYDSTFSSNDVLTSFPYFAFRERITGSEESSIIEIPVTFDDAMGFLTEKNVSSVVQTWNSIIKKTADNGGVSVLLVHTSDTRDKDYKLKAQQGVMEYVKGQDGWMGSISEYGEFWRKRAALDYRLVDNGTGIDVIIKSGTEFKGAGFTAGRFGGREFRVLDSNGKTLKQSLRKSGVETGIILE